MEQNFGTPIDTSIPLDYATLTKHLYALDAAYPFLELSYLGTSILERAIPLITLGHGRRKVLYVGTHHGMEWITAAILTRFIYDFCDIVKKDGYVGHLHCKSIFNTHTFYIVPMLNPDGTEYQIHGVQKDNPLFDRLIEMNGGSEDFGSWQANARGVDLNHNYDAGFEEYKAQEICRDSAPTRYSGESPESEPEVALLCNFIRYHEDLLGVMTLHTQGEEIFYGRPDVRPPKSDAIAARLSRLTSYTLSNPTGPAAYGGLCDWCCEKAGIPAFTVECGKGKNPLPFSHLPSLYRQLREALFTFPILL